jgi:hypothetical protein
MDAQALRAMQAPIKDRYKAEPQAAVITLKAHGTLDDTNIACKVETGRALAVAGLHPATGGSGLELCSGDMLLEALVACAGVTLKAISIFAALSGSPRTPRSAFGRFGSPSRSTPMRRRRSSTRCSSSPNAIAWFIRRSATVRRSRSGSRAGSWRTAAGERLGLFTAPPWWLRHRGRDFFHQIHE